MAPSWSPVTLSIPAISASTRPNRARARAHSLLLSGQGMTINAIAKIYHVDRDTVSTWIKKWAHQGEGSLHDQPRSGRPPKLTPEEQELAITYMKEEPRSLKQVVDRVAQKTAKRLSTHGSLIFIEVFKIL